MFFWLTKMILVFLVSSIVDIDMHFWRLVQRLKGSQEENGKGKRKCLPH